MSNFVYVSLAGGLFVVNLAVLLCLYIFKRNASYMSLSVDAQNGEVPFLSLTQGLFFTAAAVLLPYFSNAVAFYTDLTFFTAAGLAVFVAAVGFVPVRSPWARAAITVAEFCAFAAAVFVLPTPDFLTRADMPLPIGKALTALVWLAVYKVSGFGGKHDELVWEQTFFAGVVCFCAVFITSLPSREVLQTGGLLLAVSLAVVPFAVLYGADVTPSKPLVNLLNLAVTGVGYCWVVQGVWGCAVLLLSYPLFELIFCLTRAFGNLFRRQDRKRLVFVCDEMKAVGMTPWKIVDFVFKRNLLFGAMLLLTLDRVYLQKQMVLLAALLYAKFAINIVSPGTMKSSFRGLLKQIGADAKKGWRETGDSLTAVKEKYKDSDKK